MRRLYALLVALMLVPFRATAQEATPAVPVFPDPSECHTTPRTAAEIDAFAPLQQGTPSPETDARRLLLTGPTEPAAAEEIAGITATARGFAACLSRTPVPDEALTPAAEAAENRAAWGLIDPDPAACQIAPRDAAELAAMEGTLPPSGPDAVRPERTPLPRRPQPVPAHAGTVAGIEATVNELAACAAADAPLRSASLYADDLIASPYFSINTGPRRSGPEAFAVYDIQDFGDGRVGAVIGSRSAGFATPVFPLFVIFELVGDRWLISGTPSPFIDDGF